MYIYIFEEATLVYLVNIYLLFLLIVCGSISLRKRDMEPHINNNKKKMIVSLRLTLVDHLLLVGHFPFGYCHF